MSIAITAGPASSVQLTRISRSIASWIPAIVISYSALIDPLVNFGLAPGVEVGGLILGGEQKSTYLAKIFIPACFVISLVLAMIVRPRISRRFYQVAAFSALYIILAGLSSVWSAVPIGTLTHAIYLGMLYTILLLSITVSGNSEAIVRGLLFVFAAIVAANLFLVVTRQAGPIGHEGIYDHKNTMGAAAGCALLLGIFGLFEPKMFWRSLSLFVLLGAIVMIAASDSKTALASAILGSALAATLYCTSRVTGFSPSTIVVLILAVLVSGFITIGQMFGFGYNDLLIAIYGETSFTGRTDIWGFVWGYIEQAPLIGHGFRGFWTLGLASPKHLAGVDFIHTIGSSHNGFLDVALDLGLLGLTIVILIILATFGAAANIGIRPPRRSMLYISVIVFVLGRNMMESVIMWSTFFDGLAFMAIGLLACVDERQPDNYQPKEMPAQTPATVLDMAA